MISPKPTSGPLLEARSGGAPQRVRNPEAIHLGENRASPGGGCRHEIAWKRVLGNRVLAHVALTHRLFAVTSRP